MTSTMAKMTLELEEDYSYEVIGLVCSSKSHRLCWTLNRLLGIELKRERDLEIIGREKTARFHSFFSFLDENLLLKYRLVENKRGGSLFLPEVDTADYLLIMDKIDELNPNELIPKIRKSNIILLSFMIELDSLKSKQNILLAA